MARGDKAAVEDELEQFVQGRYLALRRMAYLLCGDWHRVMTYRTDDLSPTNGPTKGSYSLVAERAFPNGMQIDVVTSNYFDPLNDPHEKGWHVSPTRSTVLLTMDQLKAMLMDSRWGLTVPAQFAQQAKGDLLPYVDRTQTN